jgi:SAM-dependent methyltransferase
MRFELEGEASDEGAEGVAPDRCLVTVVDDASELDGCEAFAEGVELAGGGVDGAPAEQPSLGQALDPGVQAGQRGGCGWPRLAGELGRRECLLHCQPEQRGVVERESAKDGHAGLDEVGAGSALVGRSTIAVPSSSKARWESATIRPSLLPKRLYTARVVVPAASASRRSESALDVARRRATAAALDVTFLAGEAAALPLPDNSADVLLSVFGVIFAPDPQAAAAELGRVTADDGRILLTAWIPDGAISRVNQVAQQAVLRTLGAPAAPPPFPWHDSDALNQLVAPHGFSLTLTEHSLAFTAASPRHYLDTDSATTPRRHRPPPPRTTRHRG